MSQESRFSSDVKRIIIPLVILLSILAGDVYAKSYDLVLKNGRVMDPESGLDDVRHVGIKGGKIAIISGHAIHGKQTIDVTGLVVAPGFIDLHAHGQNDIANAFQARDGVTTALEMEIGVYPVNKWYKSREGKARINFGATVNHMLSRATIIRGRPLNSFYMDMKNFSEFGAPEIVSAELSREKIKELLNHLGQGLDDGALGIGMGIQYVPGARREEIFRIMQFAAARTVPVYVHSRNSSLIEPDSIDALQEMIANAAVTGSSVHFVHIGSSGIKQVPTMLEMIDGARQRGTDITTEIYPYTAASTAIGASIFNPGWRPKVGIDYSGLQWAVDGSRLTEQTFQKYRKENPGGRVIVHFIPPEIVEYGVAYPNVIIASDGGDWGNNAGHPRGAGSFSRVLGHYVREKKLLPLMTALRKMTLLPAKRLEAVAPMMSRKGRIQVNADADITIFDPETIIDRATFPEPMQYSTGVSHVLVGGVFIVRDGQLVEGVFPGKAIRQ